MKTKFFVFLIMSLSLLSCSYVNKKLGLRDDNEFEEIIEAVIEEKTSIDIDLTPETAE